MLPSDHGPPPGGLNIRWPDNGLGQRMALAQEERVHVHKLAAARAARANGLDGSCSAARARLGVVTTGKSTSTLSPRSTISGSTTPARALGLLVYKVGMTWPLEPVSPNRPSAGSSG